MAYAKCPDCGHVWRYRAVKGSKLAYQVCPECNSPNAPVRGSWEDIKNEC